MTVVTGAGLVGLTAAAMATDRGARVSVSDPDPSRPAAALRFGAVATVDPLADASSAASLAGVHNYTPRHLIDAVSYLEERHDAYPFAERVSPTNPLSELDSAMSEAAKGIHVSVGIIPNPGYI